ncbi:hypothetical protein PTKIN_Ptkin16aG0022300 [Pterospermum kingtungense]
MRYLLVAAAVLATVTVEVSGQPLNFYKLSLQWPPSTCSNPDPEKKCEKIPTNTFTIHGLWPHISDKEQVPSYEKNPKCISSGVIPKKKADITPQLFGRDMLNKLNDAWPDLLRKNNLGFWKGEWAKHGMCSDYPTDPKSYFSETLKLAEKYNPLNQLKAKGIQPGEKSGYQVKVVSAIRAKWVYNPQIACYKLGGMLLLWEIRFCLNKGEGTNPFGLRNCDSTVDLRTGCKSEEDYVRFPTSPLSSPEIEITRESLFNYTAEQ